MGTVNQTELATDDIGSTGPDYSWDNIRSAYPALDATTKPSGDASTPTLELPRLKLSGDTSVVNQLNKLQSKDSLLRQQAIVGANERGVASGAIHGSQQAGASERAVIDAMTPLANAEANKSLNEETSNWQQETNRRTLEYQNKYQERLDKLGYDNARSIAMAQANTALTTAMMNNTTALLNNPNIEYGQEVANKLTDILNAGQDNNNLTLNMGFRY